MEICKKCNNKSWLRRCYICNQINCSACNMGLYHTITSSEIFVDDKYHVDICIKHHSKLQGCGCGYGS